MPRFKSVDFIVRNRRPAVVTAVVEEIQECIALPDVSVADQGVVSFDLSCWTPTFAGNTGSVDVGVIVNKLGNKPFVEANPDVATLFTNYSRGLVYGAELEVHAFPAPFCDNNTDGQYQGLAKDIDYSCENDLTVTCSRAAMAHGTTQAAIQTASDEGTLRRLYNTKQASTRFNVGAPSTGAVVKSRYFPRALFQVKDLLDNLEDFRFYTRATGLITAAADPTFDTQTAKPGNTATWTVTLTPKCKVAATTTTTSPGRVYPHRLTMRIRHHVMFYVANPGLLQNVPLSAEQSTTTRATSTTSGAGRKRVADHLDDVGDTLHAGAHAIAGAAAMFGAGAALGGPQAQRPRLH
jgi:hypothetical protein